MPLKFVKLEVYWLIVNVFAACICVAKLNADIFTFPVNETFPVALLNVKFAEPPNVLESLNCIWVFAPPGVPPPPEPVPNPVQFPLLFLNSNPPAVLDLIPYPLSPVV